MNDKKSKLVVFLYAYLLPNFVLCILFLLPEIFIRHNVKMYIKYYIKNKLF